MEEIVQHDNQAAIKLRDDFVDTMSNLCQDTTIFLSKLKAVIAECHNGYLPHLIRTENSFTFIKYHIEEIIRHAMECGIEKLENTVTDVRGSWQVYLKLIYYFIKETEVLLRLLSKISKSKSAVNKVVFKMNQAKLAPMIEELNSELELISDIIPNMVIATFYDSLFSREEALSLVSKIEIPPFWYKYNFYNRRFAQWFGLIKSFIINGGNRNYQFASRWAKKVRQQIRHGNHSSLESENQGKDNKFKYTSIPVVKEIWNMTETGLGQAVVNFMKPRIRTSFYMQVPVSDGISAKQFNGSGVDAHVQVLVVCNSKLSFNIPKDWILHLKHSNRASDTMSVLRSVIHMHSSDTNNSKPMELSELAHYFQGNTEQAPESTDLSLDSNLDPSGGQDPSGVNSADTDQQGGIDEIKSSASWHSDNEKMQNYRALALRDDTVGGKRGGAHSLSTSMIDSEMQCRVIDVIVHFHGGGFISGSPSTHERYLRIFAKKTNAVVFSVHYSLAPEAKYPVALSECYFFYHWITHPNALNIKPRKIILVGDSAGGNLLLGVTFKAIQDGIRIPDGIILGYPATDLTHTLTPSRVLFSNDVLIPYCFLDLCLSAYVGENQDPRNDYFLSPLYAPDKYYAKLPSKILVMAGSFDPLLDDSIRFLRRLDFLNKKYTFELYNAPHGFWNLDAILPIAQDAIQKACAQLCSMLLSD
ncbi:uncharacterized protein LOC126320007 [Schistocerca gregaria]|uniref:uncharacterized protein LOC126320007 n=1 Tax=Schistocerca gregaria TaxID=7010 RepID=UPI00211F2B74|nr:uncharacterized protein LOC126320007 [Schistocerca gregaria]